MSARASAPAKLPPAHASQIEQGLTDLRCACACLAELIGDGGADSCSAVLALIQKAGAYIETALHDANVLDGPPVVGTAAAWLDLDGEEGGAE